MVFAAHGPQPLRWVECEGANAAAGPGGPDPTTYAYASILASTGLPAGRQAFDVVTAARL